MKLQILDIAFIAILLISGLMALVRGFTREILTLIAWGGAAFCAWSAYQNFQPLAQQYITPDWLANISLVAATFIITLIIITLITMRISDWVLDSGIGFLDRTLGFAFGVIRGLIVVAIAYIILTYIMPEDRFPQWAKNAPTKDLVAQTAQTLRNMLPQDIQNKLIKTIDDVKNNTTQTEQKNNQNNQNQNQNNPQQSQNNPQQSQNNAQQSQNNQNSEIQKKQID